MIPTQPTFEATATDLHKESKNRDYQQQLNPWYIISHLPESQNTVVACFRQRRI